LKAIGIIPARYASTRLEGKILLDIAGKTDDSSMCMSIIAIDLLAEVHVATDDSRILSAVERFGGKAHLTSPLHHSGTDRVAEVAAKLERTSWSIFREMNP